jgi:N-acetyl-gamma-glutamyl-phosphate reductase
MDKAKIAIVGATGYTGIECLRLIVNHPEVELAVVTSRSKEGIRVDDYFPSLRGYTQLKFSLPEIENLKQCDFVFFATPNGIAMKSAQALVDTGIKVIDLAADFRIKDLSVWSKWYGMEHACPNLVDVAVYGLPEINRDAIKQAQVVANPGCYPTAVQLGLQPLIEYDVINLDGIIADCKSGVSGAGRNANVGTLLTECSESFKAYGVSGHRHKPEIEERLSIASGTKINMTFVPHLTPMIRGIHATLYATLKRNIDLQTLFENRYADEHFVDVMPKGSTPETRSVKGANTCRIAVYHLENNRVVILSVIDNLVKGAAGQAIQNMNLMLGLDEKLGLNVVPLVP